MSESVIISFRLNGQDAEKMRQLTELFRKSKSEVLRFLLRSASEQLINSNMEEPTDENQQ